VRGGARKGGPYRDRYLRSLYPPETRIALICDNFSPHHHQAGRPGRGLGDREQRRDRLYADEFVLVKPRRSAVHGATVLHAGRHRPRQPHRTGHHDPPVHHLAEQPRLRRTAPPHRR